MSTSYITPQRMVTGHLSRYVRRTAALIGAEESAQPDIHAWFEPQLFSTGERQSVFAQFAAGIVWNAVSATFTLWAAGDSEVGYDAVAASLIPDPSGRLFTASAVIDLTAGAEYPLQRGIYQGEFLLTTSGGEIVSVRGRVTIRTPLDDPPPDYETGGGMG